MPRSGLRFVSAALLLEGGIIGVATGIASIESGTIVRSKWKDLLDALRQIRTSVQAVDARLGDGRRYLVGDRFSLSDMAFANALAPLVLPEGYAGPLPTLTEMPPVLKAAIAEMQSKPAGQFALRIYREHRSGA